MARKGVNALTAYCSDNLKEKIEQSAERQDISVSSWLKLAAVEKLNREEKK